MMVGIAKFLLGSTLILLGAASIMIVGVIYFPLWLLMGEGDGV